MKQWILLALLLIRVHLYAQSSSDMPVSSPPPTPPSSESEWPHWVFAGCAAFIATAALFDVSLNSGQSHESSH